MSEPDLDEQDEQPLDLPSMIRRVVEDTGEVSPYLVWAKVVAAIPDDQLRAALLKAGVAYAAARLTAPRRLGVVDDDDEEATEEGASIRAGRRTADGLGHRYSGYLCEPVHVGHRDYKQFGDCTLPDLRFAVSEREKMAKGNAHWAAYYKRVADAMDQFGAAKVADLPADFDFSEGRS